MSFSRVTSKKKTAIGRQQKKVNYVHAQQVASAADILLGLGDPGHVDKQDSADPPPSKKPRPDDNWRVRRAIQCCDNKAARANAKLDAITSDQAAVLKLNASLKEKVSEQKSTIKMLENENFIEAKNRQIFDMKKEEVHKLTIALIVEEYGQKLGAAFEYANIETSKKLEAEKARIMADSRYATNLRKERQRFSNKLKS